VRNLKLKLKSFLHRVFLSIKSLKDFFCNVYRIRYENLNLHKKKIEVLKSLRLDFFLEYSLHKLALLAAYDETRLGLAVEHLVQEMGRLLARMLIAGVDQPLC